MSRTSGEPIRLCPEPGGAPLPRHRHQRSRCIGTAGLRLSASPSALLHRAGGELCHRVSIGCMMGFLGGRFDLLMQRFIERSGPRCPSSTSSILVSLASRTSPVRRASTCCSAGWGDHLVHAHPHLQGAGGTVMAARAPGASTRRIIFNHILPNTLMMIVTGRCRGGQHLTLTALDCLGFGLAPPDASWGHCSPRGIQQPRRHLDREVRWWRRWA